MEPKEKPLFISKKKKEKPLFISGSHAYPDAKSRLHHHARIVCLLSLSLTIDKVIKQFA